MVENGRRKRMRKIMRSERLRFKKALVPYKKVKAAEFQSLAATKRRGH
jgi:hypothetical protein